MAGMCAFWCWSVALSQDVLSTCPIHWFELGESHAAQPTALQPFNQYEGTYSFGAQQSCDTSAFLHKGGLLLQVFFQLMTWLTQNIWSTCDLVTPVRWLGIRLIDLLSPGWQSILLLGHTFTLDAWVRCQIYQTPWLNQSVRITSFCTKQLQTLSMVLDSILTDSIQILELDASFGKPDTLTSSVSSRFLFSVSTISG